MNGIWWLFVSRWKETFDNFERPYWFLAWLCHGYVLFAFCMNWQCLPGLSLSLWTLWWHWAKALNRNGSMSLWTLWWQWAKALNRNGSMALMVRSGFNAFLYLGIVPICQAVLLYLRSYLCIALCKCMTDVWRACIWWFHITSFIVDSQRTSFVSTDLLDNT